MNLFIKIYSLYIRLFYPKWIFHTKANIKAAIWLKQCYRTFEVSRLGLDYSDMREHIYTRTRERLRMADDAHFKILFRHLDSQHMPPSLVLHYLIAYRLISKK